MKGPDFFGIARTIAGARDKLLAGSERSKLGSKNVPGVPRVVTGKKIP